MASPDTSTTPRQAGVQGFYQRFRAELKRDGISVSTAQFNDPAIEGDYLQSLVDTHLNTERLFWWGTIVAFSLFIILDLTTITQSVEEIIILRIATVLLVMAMVPLSYIDRFKRHFGLQSAIGMLTFALSIIAMISIMPAEGAPPYIIGVLVTFIASSCLMRIHFRIAASVYLIASIVYLIVLNVDPDFRRSDILSGHFFMVSIAFVAIFTNYAQEIRSRVIWQRDQQRTRDSATIEELLIEATAADRSKINFLSMMSHELRTPLHQIIGYTEVVTNACKASPADNDNVDHLNEIHGSAHILLSRIQKMLRYADAAAGKMNYEIEKTSIRELVEASLEQMRKAVDKKSITVDTEALTKAHISIDLVHSCYALNNIVENAINASPDNATLRISGTADDDGNYVLSIKDEGPGMSAEQINSALNPFTQGEGALARSREGLGLGLTLASQIFKAQNAEIELTSDGQTGTEALIKFTAPATDKKQATQ